MYYYIYDSFLEEKKEHAHLLARVETQINNLGLSGERARVTSLKKIDQLVLEAAQKKYDPIVIVGRDQSFSAAASCLASHKQKTALAFVPIDKQSMLARMLGVTPDNAITILSRRIIKKVPLAKANGHYFLSRVHCRAHAQSNPQTKGLDWLQKIFKKPKPTFFTPRLIIDDDCVIKSRVSSLDIVPGFSINKLKVKLNLSSRRKSWRAPTDITEQSIFWPTRADIRADQSLPVWIDGRQVSRTPLNVSLTKQEINLLVGPQRHFA